MLLQSAVLALMLVRKAHADIGASVGYQLHSYNDLREWPAALRKGMRSLKIDPQYAIQVECLLQPRANGSDPRGCLLLNHDSIIPLGDAYFVLDDVLSFLSNATFTSYFNRSGDPFAFALCFKGCGSGSCPCDNSTGFGDWASLVDDFVARALALTADLNVRWVLDGDASPHTPCLYDRWRPLVSTYISQSDPDAAFTSNNASMGYDRYQVLNEPTDLWAAAAAADYGKFVNATYPYQAWEPGDQPTILSVADTYIGVGLLHPPGLNIATNADVAQFETYAGTRTGRAWDHLLTDVYTASNVSAAGAFAVPGSATATCVFTVTASGTMLVHSVAHVGAAPQPLGTFDLGVNGLILGVSGIRWQDGVTSAVLVVLVAPQLISMQVYNVSSTAYAPWTQLNVSVPDVTASSSATAVALPAASSLADIRVIIAAPAQNTSTQQQCRVYTSVYRGDGSSIGLPTCVGTLTQSTVSSIISSSIACAPLGADAVACALVASDDSSTIRGLSACVNSSSGAVIAVNDPSICASTMTPLLAASDTLLYTHVGADARVALQLGDDGLLHVLEAHGNGYCPNNEPQNKVAIIKLCDQAPHVDAGAQYLNYNVGLLSDWTAQLVTGAGASACSAQVLHGMYGMGSGPSPFFFSANATATAIGPDFGIVSVAFDGAGGDPNDCGIAVAVNGSALQLHGWTFPAAGGSALNR